MVFIDSYIGISIDLVNEVIEYYDSVSVIEGVGLMGWAVLLIDFCMGK